MTDPEMQAKIATNLADVNARRGKKINANQARIDAGFTRKHMLVELRDEQTIAGVLSTPEVWTQIQSEGGKALLKGDLVSVISPDGLAMADSAMVIKTERGRCWFSKPLRMVSFEATGLFNNGTYEVVTYGTGYVIKTLRDGLINYGQVFPSPKAAEHEIERRTPVKVA